MDLDELTVRLGRFCRAQYDEPEVRVVDVRRMPGHAGFAYGFSVAVPGRSEHWFLRLPPPNVRWEGTADVLRQVEVLNALDGTTVPHCRVRWSGDDLTWFGSPYFVVPRLEGDVLRLGPGEWGSALPPERLEELAGAAMSALAEVHALDWRRLDYLGPPIPLTEDVVRWDRLLPRAAEPERLAEVPRVRQRLLETRPVETPVGVFHGDFQAANLFCSLAGDLLAVIDWELVGVGAILNDVGWIATFSDAEAFAPGATWPSPFLDPEALIGLYAKASTRLVSDVNWFRALAAYKFALITGFNLALHRRGKRPDPMWEETKHSMAPLLSRALELLG